MLCAEKQRNTSENFSVYGSQETAFKQVKKDWKRKPKLYKINKLYKMMVSLQLQRSGSVSGGCSCCWGGSSRQAGFQ